MPRKRLLYVSIACLLLAGGAMLYFFNPAQTRLFAPCPFFYVTDLHCPGCGTLRGLNRLLHGQLGAAFALNPLMVLSIPILGIMIARPTLLTKRWVPWTVLWVLVVFAVARNIPSWPFTVLAPH